MIDLTDVSAEHIRSKLGCDPEPGVVYSVFKCGCVLDNRIGYGVEIRRESGGKKRACPDCLKDGPLLTKFRVCQKCGIEVVSSIMCHPVLRRCSECTPAIKRWNEKRKINRALAQARKKKNIVPGALKDWSVDPRGDYCKLLPGCKVIGCVSCKGCDKMVPLMGCDPDRISTFCGSGRDC